MKSSHSGEVIVASLLRSHFLATFPTSHFSASASASAAPGTYRYVLQKNGVPKTFILQYANQNLSHVLHVALHVTTCNENLHVKTAKLSCCVPRISDIVHVFFLRMSTGSFDHCLRLTICRCMYLNQPPSSLTVTLPALRFPSLPFTSPDKEKQQTRRTARIHHTYVSVKSKAYENYRV